ncbi:MAG: hypothetical protein AAFQ82_00065 [Myxococcota bacterium]
MRHIAVLAWLTAAAGCSQPAYSVRVPVHDATYPSMLSAATDAIAGAAGAWERVDESGAVRLRGSKGVEELDVVVERYRDETRVLVYISRPELYPPGIGEAFWRGFQTRLKIEQKSWLAVEAREKRAGL